MDILCVYVYTQVYMYMYAYMHMRMYTWKTVPKLIHFIHTGIQEWLLHCLHWKNLTAMAIRER